MFVEGGKYLPKKSKTKRFDRRERGRKRTLRGEGAGFAEETIPPPIEIHTWLQATALKIPNTKSPRRYTVIPRFTYFFFYLVAPIREREKERKERQQEEQRIGNEITV